ncbi:hypothetical protein B0H19DRAFT_90965 [Mycena capillaripes]|nr:hypothetical protein B0H19DRAFT_90965 [Mycena capillaripes]
MAAADTRILIEEIDYEIARLQEERQALVDSLTFPVVALPVEIISEIFLHCIPENPLDPGAFNAPVVLGHVCRQWRDIALSLTDLWSAWSLAIDGNIPFKRLITGANLWLARSQNCPLSIRLHHRDGASPDVSDQDERWRERASDFENVLMSAIAPHHRRWQNIELNVPLTVLRHLSQVTPDDGLPYLTHLLLGSVQEDWGGADPDEEPITMFADAPQLRSLHLVLEAEDNLSRLDHVHLPYEQLTHFTGTLFGTLECLTLLAKTKSLVDCVFYVGNRVRTQDAVESTLHRLKSLKLFTTATDAHPALILAYLTLPSLETLVVGHQPQVMPHALAALVLRSKCTLRHFSCQSMEREELVDCLQATPLLTTLDLFDYDQRDVVDVIRHLDYMLEEEESSGTPLVPNLQSIVIRCQKRDRGRDGDFSYNALLLLLERLGKRPTPLRSFRLMWTMTSLLPGKPNEWDIEGFQYLVKDGMDIYVGTQECSWISHEASS